MALSMPVSDALTERDGVEHADEWRRRHALEEDAGAVLDRRQVVTEASQEQEAEEAERTERHDAREHADLVAPNVDVHSSETA